MWGDGELKKALVHQDRLKVAHGPDDASRKRIWFAKTRHTMEPLRDNEDDAMPVEEESKEDQRVAEFYRRRTAHEAYLMQQEQLSVPTLPAVFDASRARSHNYRFVALLPFQQPTLSLFYFNINNPAMTLSTSY